MRTTWLTTVSAVCAAALAANPATGSPAGFVQPGPRTAAPPAAAAPVQAADASAPPATPSRNPLQYVAARIAELQHRAPGAAAAPPAVPQSGAPPAAAASAGSPTPQQLIAAAQDCERSGDIRQARQHYHQALTMWPGHVEVLRAAARMEDRQGELALAETLYQQATAVNPQHAGALNDLGLCLARQGKLDASIQVIEQAIHLQPDKALYRNNAATVLVEMREDQRALAHLAAVHAPAEANYNFGQLLVQRGRAADATPYFQAAVEHRPDMESARVALARLQGQGAAAGPAPSPATPSTPATAPHAQPTGGPQITYPGVGYSPEAGAASYMPPGYQPSASPYPATGYPSHAGAVPPRYLPPVATQPGATRR